MAYYYIHPFKPQYFFPEGFEEDAVFRSFFQPYSFRGKISWSLFCNSHLYRQFFKKENIEPYIPEQKIRNILDKQSLMAFNRGTAGLEQKITALGREAKDYFFIKYAQTPLARENVGNEYKILKQLESNVVFAPVPQDFHQDEQQVLLQTGALKGRRVQASEISESMFNILLQLPELDIKGRKMAENDCIQVFAHGDFCPWNMMVRNGKLALFDWEMGGTYPLGYDLFTFIFQTSFLLTPEKPIKEIITFSEPWINRYFDHFRIEAWGEYLLEFARIKAALEKNKDDKELYNQYKKLKKYA